MSGSENQRLTSKGPKVQQETETPRLKGSHALKPSEITAVFKSAKTICEGESFSKLKTSAGGVGVGGNAPQSDVALSHHIVETGEHQWLQHSPPPQVRIQINKIRSEREVTTDITEIQRLVRDYYSQLYASELDNLKEMDKCLETDNLPRLNHEKYKI